MKAIDEALALLRRRPGAATPFLRPGVDRIVTVAYTRGVKIHGES